MDDQPTILWTLSKADRHVSCRVRLAPYGIEIDIVSDGTPVVTRVFDNGDEALAWADAKRASRTARGWS